MNRLGLDKNTEELRKLILENPDLPIVVLAGEEANIDYGFMYCSWISFDIGEILDCEYFNDYERVFTDRGYLEEYLEEKIYDELCDKQSNIPTDDQVEEILKKRLEEFEPYWKKVIAIYADN